MANEDKGLLEDLIGESLEGDGGEETQPAATAPNEFFDEDMGGSDPDMGFEDDSQLMNEIGGKKSGRGNKLLIVLAIFLVLFGLLGAAIKFQFIQLPLPKFLYDPDKNKIIDISKIQLSENMKGKINKVKPLKVKKPAAPVLQEGQIKTQLPMQGKSPASAVDKEVKSKREKMTQEGATDPVDPAKKTVASIPPASEPAQKGVKNCCYHATERHWQRK